MAGIFDEVISGINESGKEEKKPETTPADDKKGLHEYHDSFTEKYGEKKE